MSGIKETISGEFKMDLNGTTFRLKPSFECLVSIEDEVGAIAKFVQRAAVGEGADITIREITFVIHQGILAGEGEKICPEYAALGTMILKKGLLTCMIEAIQFLSRGILDEEQQKKVNDIVKKHEKGSKKKK